MSLIIANSKHWPGFAGIRRFFIFSIFAFPDGYSESSHPNAEQPLGTEFPGITYTEPGLPNWVGHLITNYCPPPRLDPEVEEQDEEFRDNPILVYNYAMGGDQVGGVARQVRRLFLPQVGTKPAWAPWTENESLFGEKKPPFSKEGLKSLVTSVGINDCAYSNARGPRIEMLMDLQNELYESGARNFLFFDVPPIDQAPALAERRIRHGLDLNLTEESSYQKWNSELLEALEKFKFDHLDCTVLLFSIYRMFTVVLEDLETYEFPPSHKNTSNGTVWLDHIHPSSKIHGLIAQFLCDFLNDVPVLAKEAPQDDSATLDH